MIEWFKKTDDLRVEVQEIKQRRVKVVVPHYRVRELLEEEARKIYKGNGNVDHFSVREVGPPSTNTIKENECTVIFFEKL